MDNLYVVSESGGADYSPNILGIFDSYEAAKSKLKSALISFIEIHVMEPGSTVVEKTSRAGLRGVPVGDQYRNATYSDYHVYQDRDEHLANNYMNVFTIATIKETVDE